MIPVNTNHDLQCGSRLEVKILPGTANPTGPVSLTIRADNVDMEVYEAAEQTVEYTLVVVPVHRLEVMGLKTELQAGEEAVPFGVAAFDKDGNELDTLDGVQLGWFIGAKKEVAKFQGSQVGPIVHLEPLSGGAGAVIAVINDPNYSQLEPAVREFRVAAPLHLEPDGIYLLAGGEANITLYERIGEELRPLPISGPDAEFRVESREQDIARVEADRGVVVAGGPDEETSLLVKDLEGNILKGVPIRTVSPARLVVAAHPHPESKQLLVNHEYNITVTMYDEDDHEIFPSENILTKTTFGKQYEVLDISVNGLWARVIPTGVGIGKIKASLRSTLTPEDDETEITPHLKGVTDFELFESVLITPRRTVLPWDSQTRPEYELSYKVTGGGKVYGYEVSPDNLATVDSEGKVRVVNGPGLLTVTAGMTNSMHNNQTAEVALLGPTHLNLPESTAEFLTSHTIQLPVAIFALDPHTKESVLFSDCSDIDLKVELSNTKDFQQAESAKRGDHTPTGACTTINLRASSPGATTKVTVSYTIPNTKKVLKSFRHISTYEYVACVMGRHSM